MIYSAVRFIKCVWLAFIVDALRGAAFAGERIEVPLEIYPFAVVGVFLAGVFIKHIANSNRRSAEAPRYVDAFQDIKNKEEARKRHGLSSWDPNEIAKLLPAYGNEDAIDISVFAPPEAQPYDEICVQVLFHAPNSRKLAKQLANENDSNAELLAARPLKLPLKKHDRIKVTIESGVATIEHPTQLLIWNGELAHCLFKVRIAGEALRNHELEGRVIVFVNGIAAGEVVFIVKIKSEASIQIPLPVGKEARRYKQAFLSYASEDRAKVLATTQVFAALDVNYFQDLTSLTPGERWDRRLYEEIDRCDVFYIYWSKFAARSEWVVKEAEYALRRAEDPKHKLRFYPIILEVPCPQPAPPLSERHFNDPIRYVIFAEEETHQINTAIRERTTK